MQNYGDGLNSLEIKWLERWLFLADSYYINIKEVLA